MGAWAGGWFHISLGKSLKVSKSITSHHSDQFFLLALGLAHTLLGPISLNFIFWLGWWGVGASKNQYHCGLGGGEAHFWSLGMRKYTLKAKCGERGTVVK